MITYFSMQYERLSTIVFREILLKKYGAISRSELVHRRARKRFSGIGRLMFASKYIYIYIYIYIYPLIDVQRYGPVVHVLKDIRLFPLLFLKKN